MRNSSITGQRSHRPFPLPQAPWVMKQGWSHLLFTHWPADDRDLLPFIPEGLMLDKWEGRPWISMSPFLMDPLRLRGTPPVPFAGKFLELNVRTYVTCRGKPGIWFLGLEASSRLAVLGARLLARLPYHHAQMGGRFSDDGGRYVSTRRSGSRQLVFEAEYRAASPEVFHAGPGSLLHWLSERYCLYTADRNGKLYTGDIHHLPWPLQLAEASIATNTLAQHYGLGLPSRPAAATYTKRLEVLFWPVRRI